MSFAETRARIKANIWQAVAQSGVDVSGLPEGEMDRLVTAITESMLQDVDDMLGQVAEQEPLGDDGDEEILWQGRPYLSMSVRYQITSERVRIVEGLLSRERRDIELVRIQDIDHKQNITERTLNMGDVHIRSHDVTDPEIVLNNVTDPAEVHEILRRAVLKARGKHNMSYREEM